MPFTIRIFLARPACRIRPTWPSTSVSTHFTAFEVYLDQSGPDLDPAMRMLVSEYCKYALGRAWYYYPDALPADILATGNRNGHVDHMLSFPLEDLYPEGQSPGKVGQEIYGAGAALVFATRSFHPWRVPPSCCSAIISSVGSERLGDRSLSILLDGGETCVAALSIGGNHAARFLD